GNGGQAIFLDDEDRSLFLELLSEVALDNDWIVFAWCLMDNHYHLLLRTQQPTLSKGMRQIGGIYTQCFNRRHRRAGHLFQGRYKALLVEGDSYLMQLHHYILNNPVKAGLAKSVLDYPWCSAAQSLAEPWPAWFSAELLFGLIQGEADRQAALRAFLTKDLGEPKVNQQLYYGSQEPETIERLRRKATLVEAALVTPVEYFASKYSSREAAMAAAVLEGFNSASAVARHFDVYPSTVTRAVKRYKAKMQT
ncbi:transposase, partial [Alphaproteobacteria bacterium]|nr:transposase [Alphaproteobacteria bacterium]